jgi:single-stranded DNA-binding protein
VGCVTLFPLKPDGTEMVWGLTPATLPDRLSKGFVKATRSSRNSDDFTISYLTSGQIANIEADNVVVTFDLAHNFRERAGNGIKDVAAIFFNANVWEEDGAAEVAELGLTKGSRVAVEGVWSKRTWTTKDGQRRITEVLTVRKIRLLTETEISASEVVDDDEPAADEPVPEPAA